MKGLRILGSVLLLFIFLFSAAAPLPAAAITIPDLTLPLVTIRIPTPTPKPTISFTINPFPTLNLPKGSTPPPAATPVPTAPPTATPAPAATPKATPKQTPKTTKKPTNETLKPTEVPARSGQLMTSEGPLFLSFRTDLTEQYWMFTPVDLSLNGQFNYPLVADASHVVGEVKVEVESGMVVVSYLLVNGVSVDAQQEFFTFFTDIGSVTTVDSAQLQDVKMAFNIPYHVTTRLDTDPNVLLYVNTPLSYDANQPGLKGFSFRDEGYLQRLAVLYPLMD